MAPCLHDKQLLHCRHVFALTRDTFTCGVQIVINERRTMNVLYKYGNCPLFMNTIGHQRLLQVPFAPCILIPDRFYRCSHNMHRKALQKFLRLSTDTPLSLPRARSNVQLEEVRGYKRVESKRAGLCLVMLLLPFWYNDIFWGLPGGAIELRPLFLVQSWAPWSRAVHIWGENKNVL